MFPTIVPKCSPFPSSLTTLVISCLSPNRHSNRWQLIVVLICISLMSVVVGLLSCVWLFCNPMDWTPRMPGSFCSWDFPSMNTGWVSVSSSRACSWPRNQTHVSCIGKPILYHRATREAPVISYAEHIFRYLLTILYVFLLWKNICSAPLPFLKLDCLGFFFSLLILSSLFLAVLGLQCCMWAFFSHGEQGLLFIAVHRLLIAVASLLWSPGCRHMKLSGGSARAQWWWYSGFVALQHVESSWIRDWTRVPCIARWILNRCSTRQVLTWVLYIYWVINPSSDMICKYFLPSYRLPFPCGTEVF